MIETLQPLPQPEYAAARVGMGAGQRVWTAKEMRAYAAAAAAAERERCAMVCEDQAQTDHNQACPRAVDGWWPDQVTYACALAIRAPMPAVPPA